MSMTTDFSKQTGDGQNLRAIALRAQLLALDAQAEALRAMDREHSLGVESSFYINSICQKIHDFMNDVFAQVRKSDETDILAFRASLTVLLERSKSLKAESDDLKVRGGNAAQFRFALTGGAATSPAATEPQQAGAVPVDPEKLQNRADFACLRAEVDEFAAFALQIHALANLAMEYCFTAAVRCRSC